VALGVTTARAAGSTLTLGAGLLGLAATLRCGAADLGATAELAAARTRLGVTRLARGAGLLLTRLEEIGEVGRVATLDRTAVHAAALVHASLDRRILATRHLVALGLATARAAGSTLALGAGLLGLATELRRRAADLGATADLATAATGGTTRLAGRALFAGLEEINLRNATTFDGRHLLYTAVGFRKMKNIFFSSLCIFSSFPETLSQSRFQNQNPRTHGLKLLQHIHKEKTHKSLRNLGPL
jgi:hypothetical protein